MPAGQHSAARMAPMLDAPAIMLLSWITSITSRGRDGQLLEEHSVENHEERKIPKRLFR